MACIKNASTSWFPLRLDLSWIFGESLELGLSDMKANIVDVLVETVFFCLSDLCNNTHTAHKCYVHFPVPSKRPVSGRLPS